MAEMVLKLTRDPSSGRPLVVVELHSDADSLPFEHEEAHRKILEQLIGRGLLEPGETAELVITRSDKAGNPIPTSTKEENIAQPNRQGNPG